MINQVFCMAIEPQAWVHSGLGMGIILTMPDQMTPVIESSVVMAQVSCSSSAMPEDMIHSWQTWLLFRALRQSVACISSRFFDWYVW